MQKILLSSVFRTPQPLVEKPSNWPPVHDLVREGLIRHHNLIPVKAWHVVIFRFVSYPNLRLGVALINKLVVIFDLGRSIGQSRTTLP